MQNLKILLLQALLIPLFDVILTKYSISGTILMSKQRSSMSKCHFQSQVREN